MVSKVMVNEREILSIIDQMRISVPEEIREARRLLREREQIPQSAQMEADQIIAKAREQAEAMIRDEEIVRQAQVRADEVLIEAEEQDRTAHEEMDAYVLNMLQDLERRLATHLTSVERGIQAIESQPEAQAVEAVEPTQTQ